MKLIIVKGKAVFISIFIILICISFLTVFFTGDKNILSLPVLSQRLVPIYKVDRDDNKISITLDGTWGANYTEELLEIFAEHDLQITFFFAGYWLEKYPDLVKKIFDQGHEVENHSYTHPHFNSLSPTQIKKELEDTSMLIKNITGKKPRFFRPPFGEYNNKVIEVVTNLNYQVIQWSLDSLDWKEPGTDSIINRVLNNVSPGEIILMHNNAPETPDALRALIPALKENGYDIVPLSELVYEEDYKVLSHNGLQVKLNKAGGDKNE